MPSWEYHLRGNPWQLDKSVITQWQPPKACAVSMRRVAVVKGWCDAWVPQNLFLQLIHPGSASAEYPTTQQDQKPTLNPRFGRLVVDWWYNASTLKKEVMHFCPDLFLLWIWICLCSLPLKCFLKHLIYLCTDATWQYFTLCHIPLCSPPSAFLPLWLKCTLDSPEHSWALYTQFPEKRGSWGRAWDRIRRVSVFPFLLPWRQFYNAFLKSPWNVPKRARQSRRTRVIVWVDYSWMHCAEFYNKKI